MTMKQETILNINITRASSSSKKGTRKKHAEDSISEAKSPVCSVANRIHFIRCRCAFSLSFSSAFIPSSSSFTSFVSSVPSELDSEIFVLFFCFHSLICRCVSPCIVMTADSLHDAWTTIKQWLSAYARNLAYFGSFNIVRTEKNVEEKLDNQNEYESHYSHELPNSRQRNKINESK